MQFSTETTPSMNDSVDFLLEDSNMAARAAHSAHLWFDSNGKRLPIRYSYPNDYPHDYIFHKIIEYWADNTCLTFKRDQSADCSATREPILSIQALNYATDRFGVDPKKPCMITSLGGGLENLAQKVIMGALGMLPYTLRKDSDKYISMNEENLKTFITVKEWDLKSELTAYHKCHGKTPVLPTPFDYQSRTMPSSNELGSTVETRPVYVTLDPQYQYLLDHAAAAKQSPTFYDALVINLLYKCSAEWASACSGVVPKCKNHGYLLKTCRCRCPPGFDGTECEKKTGPMFPIQPGAYQVTVSTGKSYDFASLNIKGVELADGDNLFRFYVFVVIHVVPKDAKHLPSLSLVLPFQKAGATLTRLTEKLLRYLDSTDCRDGLRLLWGSGRRLACECFSSLVTNEPPAEARVFRGRRSSMGMTLINSLGATFPKEAGLTELTSQFRLAAEFRRPHELSLAEKPGAQPVPVTSGDGGGGGGDAGGGGGGSGADGNGTDGSGGVIGDGNSPGTAALKNPFAGIPGLGTLAILGPLSLLFLLLCLLMLLTRGKRRKKKAAIEEEEEQSETDEDEDSGADTETSEDG